MEYCGLPCQFEGGEGFENENEPIAPAGNGEVTKEKYESRLADFWANYVPPEPEADPELTDTEALKILLGGAV